MLWHTRYRVSPAHKQKISGRCARRAKGELRDTRRDAKTVCALVIVKRPSEYMRAMLPHQKIELGIYERVKALGPGAVTMTLGVLSESTGEDHATITERLKSLEAEKRITLSKYSGGSIWPRASIVGDDSAFFYVGSFLIDIIPQGRGYFEELEQLGKREAESPRVESTPGQNESTAALQGTPRDVFVIHGRDERLRAGMFQFLRSLSLNPIEWSQAVELTGKAAPYVGEALDAAFSHARAVVVLFSPDDLVRLRPDLCGPHESPHETNFTQQARPNALFEAGMAMARHPNRTVLVEIGTLRPFSDIGGRHTIQMDNSPKKRQELAQRLEKAGCPVNLRGTDWQTAGDLNAQEPFNLSTSAPPEARLCAPTATAARADQDSSHAHPTTKRRTRKCTAPSKVLQHHYVGFKAPLSVGQMSSIRRSKWRNNRGQAGMRRQCHPKCIPWNPRQFDGIAIQTYL